MTTIYSVVVILEPLYIENNPKLPLQNLIIDAIMRTLNF